jgi:hypothetical protein
MIFANRARQYFFPERPAVTPGLDRSSGQGDDDADRRRGQQGKHHAPAQREQRLTASPCISGMITKPPPKVNLV